MAKAKQQNCPLTRPNSALLLGGGTPMVRHQGMTAVPMIRPPKQQHRPRRSLLIVPGVDKQKILPSLPEVLRPVHKLNIMKVQCTPLHKAAYLARIPPGDIVQTLMECFPTAARMRDDQGKLPMHAAVSFSVTSVENVQLLYQFYPQAVSVQDEDDAYPFHLLAWGGASKDALPILLLLLQRDY